MSDASFRVREVLTNGEPSKRPAKNRFEECPVCGKTLRADSLRRHLTTTHHMTARAAADALREMHNPQPDLPVATNGDHPEPEPSVLTDISAVEAVTGILSAARTDKLLPTRLLPAAYDLIKHTELVLGELARLSE